MNINFKHVFFSGIGGISMSALAELMLSKGYKVSGSDITDTNLIDLLRKNGAKVYIGHSLNNIADDVDLFVYTSAVNNENLEYVCAKDRGIKILTRAEFLGEVMTEHHNSIAVSGTHGKTTTTGMLSSVLINSDLDPTIFLGGELASINGNIKIGNGDLLLTEACEYRRNFLSFKPTVEVILNIDADHLDYYKDLTDVELAFQQFAGILPANGTLVLNNKYKSKFADVKANVITFGLTNESDIYARNIKYTPLPKFEVVYKGNVLGEIQLLVYGEYNVLNSLAAIAASLAVGVDFENIKNGLEKFVGTKRRFENKGKVNGITIIDDYAHHPTEIEASLKSARTMTNGKIITIFQPHTYTRTSTLFKEFVDVFKLTDKVVFIDIYAAREKDTGLVSSKQLTDATNERNNNAFYAKSFEESAKMALEMAKDGDIIIAMGAGTVSKLPEILLREGKK